MNRFDDPRDMEKTLHNDPRNMRYMVQEEKSENNKKPKSIKELIEEETALEADYRKEMAEATENGKLSPKSMLLQQAQREELFDKMCAVYDKYVKKFQSSFEEYRRKLGYYKEDMGRAANSAYDQGYKEGYAAGVAASTKKLMAKVDAAKHLAVHYRIISWLCGIYGAIATVVILVMLIM